jgi:hypothetical protein
MACCPTSPDRAELVDDLFLRREPPLVTLREDHLIPDADVEDPSAAADDLWLDVEFLPDLDRQTGGSGEVVSNAAIFNRDLQRPSSVPIVLLANCQPTRGDSVPPSKPRSGDISVAQRVSVGAGADPEQCQAAERRHSFTRKRERSQTSREGQDEAYVAAPRLASC